MKVSHAAASARRPRPSRVPLPSLHAAERVRGAGILEECGGDGCGVVLWESFRNVSDWAATPHERREVGLFSDGAAERRTAQIDDVPGMERDLRAALVTIRDLLADPCASEPKAVAAACGTVASWAAAQGRPTTRFYFTAAAAACVPEDARQAYQAGCVARDLARWDAAEQWLEYAVATAKRGRDRATQAVSLLGIGNAFYRQGFYRRAKDVHKSGLAIASKYGLREFQGRAHHDLFVVAVMLQEGREAEENAQAALAAYGAAHPNIPVLAHDVAQFWLRSGQSARALKVLQALLPRMSRPDHRLHVLSSLAWAAGDSRRKDVFDQMWKKVWAAAGQQDAAAAMAPALLQLAYGAACLGDTSRAEEAAREALRAAEERQETDVITEGTAFLATLGTRSQALLANPIVADATAAEESDGRLAEELVRTLIEV